MSVIKLLSKAYLLVLSLFMFYLSYRWVFGTNVHLAMLGITVEGIHGINTLKSIMGSSLLMFAIMPILALYRDKTWFTPLALFVAVLLVVRVLSLVMDGFHLKMGIYAVLEVLILLAIFALSKPDDKDSGITKK